MNKRKVLLALLASACASAPLSALAAPMDSPRGSIQLVSEDADNTARNVKDRGDTLSPLDQGTSESDVTITQQIRQSVVADDQLSMNAKNVKIITIDGMVTLRGPVKSAGEKNAIVATAKQTAGVVKVDDQLEVETNP